MDFWVSRRGVVLIEVAEPSKRMQFGRCQLRFNATDPSGAGLGKGAQAKPNAPPAAPRDYVSRQFVIPAQCGLGASCLENFFFAFGDASQRDAQRPRPTHFSAQAGPRLTRAVGNCFPSKSIIPDEEVTTRQNYGPTARWPGANMLLACSPPIS